MIEKEPITVILSAKGWVRAMKGHIDLGSADAVKFKEGDGPAFAFHAQTTDKLLLATDSGRFHTLAADKLPGGRGFGEPVRLLADIRSEEHTSELQSLMRISYAVFCLKKKTRNNRTPYEQTT